VPDGVVVFGACCAHPASVGSKATTARIAIFDRRVIVDPPVAERLTEAATPAADLKMSATRSRGLPSWRQPALRSQIVSERGGEEDDREPDQPHGHLG